MIVLPTASQVAIATVLARFPDHLLLCTTAAQMRIRVLDAKETYRDASRVLRRLTVGVDDWPIPPAGLFVVEERTVYLRSISAMTITHETMHAVDCALGHGLYLSGIDPRIRRAFENAHAFVTPYAACGIDEYFAEAGRAMLDTNDPNSLWPPATSRRLLQLDPSMHGIMTDIFTAPIPTERAS